MSDLEKKAKDIADAVIGRMILDDNYDAIHGLAMRTVGLLAWQTMVNEQTKAAKLTECPHCGPNCKRGAAHNARKEDGAFYKAAELSAIIPSRLLDISGLDDVSQIAIRLLFIEIVGGMPYGSTLNLEGLHEPLRDAFQTITVGLLAWQTMVNEQTKAAKLTECPHCGPNCKGILSADPDELDPEPNWL